MSTYTPQKIVVGDTIDFTLAAKKNGSAWNITGGSVLLYLVKPDATVLGPFDATLSSPTTGGAHYAVDTDVIDQSGDWVRQWKVSAEGITLWSQEIGFPVYPRAV